MHYDDAKTGPFAAAAFSVQMLLWAPAGEQYSGAERPAMPGEAGVVEVEVKPTFGYWSVVTGRKPRGWRSHSRLLTDHGLAAPRPAEFGTSAGASATGNAQRSIRCA